MLKVGDMIRNRSRALAKLAAGMVADMVRLPS
jgi:hypothetical protein